MIAQVATGVRWVRVDQELPDADEVVLGYCRESDCYRLCYRGEDDAFYDSETCHEILTVSHWQRLDGPLSPPEDVA